MFLEKEESERRLCICTWASRWQCHIGEILGIFDLDNASWAYKTREFLEQAEQEGRVISVCDDLPRSFVLVGRRRGRPQSTSLSCPPPHCCGGRRAICFESCRMMECRMQRKKPGPPAEQVDIGTARDQRREPHLSCFCILPSAFRYGGYYGRRIGTELHPGGARLRRLRDPGAGGPGGCPEAAGHVYRLHLGVRSAPPGL